MLYCNNCGVELDKNMNYCPLCGLAAGEKKPPSPESVTKTPDIRRSLLSEIKNLTIAQRRMLFWEISGIILISGIIITLMINIIINKNVSWAKYNLVASLSVFANISLFTFWRSRPFLIVIGSLISNALLLMLLDLISFNIGWGTRLGVPVLISFYVLLIAELVLIRFSRRQGFNILATIFLAIGVFLICIEVFVSLYYNEHVILSWSLIAGSSMIPISALLFFVYYRLRKGIDLRRFFHI
jgi:hypothetical protein